MKNLLNSILVKKPNMSRFDLTHDIKLTGQMGMLLPIMYMEVVPSDKVSLNCEALVKFAPLIAPVMHRMDITIHYFQVPYRLLWDNFENAMTMKENYQFPYVTHDPASNPNIRRLDNLLGVGYGATVSRNFTAFPWAAYQCVYNEYYRDQNLINEVDWKLVDGNNNTNPDLRQLRYRAWEHDYFTAALPFAQKGNAVNIPLGIEGQSQVQSYNGQTLGAVTGPDPVVPTNTDLPNDGTMYIEGSSLSSSGTINDLRRAFRLQEWLEKNARGGTRYIEWIKQHFGINSPDARLQRPEYITGMKAPIVISEILNTTGESAGLPQGNMAGHGVSLTAGNVGTAYASEFGAIIGICSITPKTGYANQTQKYLFRQQPTDFYNPSFDHIGEQPVTLQEVHPDGDVGTFGYVPRYCEYKYMNGRVCGDFTTSLDYWTLDRKFALPPNLNQAFIECNPADVSRIFAVEDGTDNLYMHIVNKVSALRPMSKYSTPTI